MHRQARQSAPHEQIIDLAIDDAAGPSQSQKNDYRRLNPDEETALVKIAVRHADIRKQASVRAFCSEVVNTFAAEHGWLYKSVGRKLLDLESEWREIFRRRATGTGSKNEGNNDLTQAMQAWLAIVDEEKRTKKERQEVKEVARNEVAEASIWRTNLSQRLRNKTRELNALQVVELLSDEEHVDISDNENTVAAEAAHAVLPREGPSTPLSVSDLDAPASSTEQSSPTPARGTARGNGRKRPGIMSSPLSVKSPRKDAGASTVALILQLDERRAIREEAARKEQAERDELREQRREEREVAARERELAAQRQMQLQMMQQMNIMMQAIVYRREQPVQLQGDYPPQNYAPPAPPPFQGIRDENSHYSSEAATRQSPD